MVDRYLARSQSRSTLVGRVGPSAGEHARHRLQRKADADSVPGSGLKLASIAINDVTQIPSENSMPLGEHLASLLPAVRTFNYRIPLFRAYAYRELLDCYSAAKGPDSQAAVQMPHCLAPQLLLLQVSGVALINESAGLVKTAGVGKANSFPANATICTLIHAETPATQADRRMVWPPQEKWIIVCSCNSRSASAFH